MLGLAESDGLSLSISGLDDGLSLGVVTDGTTTDGDGVVPGVQATTAPAISRAAAIGVRSRDGLIVRRVMNGAPRLDCSEGRMVGEGGRPRRVGIRQ